MNREIKFRAWDGGLKKWYYLDLQHALINQTLDINSKLEDVTDWMQFTGLKDKNGKEIYEGDIVRRRELNRPADIALYGLGESIVMGDKPRKVEWNNCGFEPFAGWIDRSIADMGWEIIGNIYENPELLTEDSIIKNKP